MLIVMCDSVHVIVWQCAYVTVCMSLCDSVYVWVCSVHVWQCVMRDSVHVWVCMSCACDSVYVWQCSEQIQETSIEGSNTGARKNLC